MGMRKRNRTSYDAATQKRRNEIAALLATGILKAEPAIKPLSEKVSKSPQNVLEFSPKTMISVSIEQ